MEGRLAVLSYHQREAGLDVREALLAAAEGTSAPDLIALGTCHRVELYCVAADGAAPRDHAAATLGLEGLPPPSVERRGIDAARHLFRVAAGLDSALRGEAQIHGQVRHAYEAARARRLDPLLAAVFQEALRVARTLRAQGPLAGVRRSIGSLAVDLLVAELGRPADATVLLVGAGEVGKLAARALAKRVGTVLVVNRDAARGAAAAAAAGGIPLTLDDLPAAVAHADAVVSAADSRGTLLTAALLGPRAAAGPLLVVDIAVPRSVAADARALSNVRYWDVDDIAVADGAADEATLAVAEERCAAAAEAFVSAWRERAAAATIRALHDRAGAIRDRQVARALARLGHLGERDRRVVDALARALTSALLHEPTVALRADPNREDAARALFRLDRA